MNECLAGFGLFMLDLPTNFQVVTDDEYQSLSYLPEFEERGGCLARFEGTNAHFVIRESDWDHMTKVTAEIEAESLSDSEPTFELPQEITPPN